MDEPSQDSFINKEKDKRKKKHRWIIGSVVLAIAMIVVSVAYYNSINNALALQREVNRTNQQSKVGASAAAAGNVSVPDKKQDQSPTLLDANATQEKEKEQARNKGYSHIDSTDVLSSERKQGIDTAPASKNESDIDEEQDYTPSTKETETDSKGKEPEITRDQLLAQNMAALLSPKPYYPPSQETVQIKNTFMTKYGDKQTKDLITNVAAKDNPAYSDHLAKKEEERKKREAELIAKNTPTNVNNVAGGSHGENNEQRVRVLNMGESTTGTITRSINSDYNVDVFIELTDAPLDGVIARGTFEFSALEDGLLLRVNMLQKDDFRIPVDGYVIDIAK
ncbi:hypothetical protein ERJ77_21845, partial [Vibrio anguillarum]|nr:hypothetical protein [Vibrio anguillarum]